MTPDRLGLQASPSGRQAAWGFALTYRLAVFVLRRVLAGEGRHRLLLALVSAHAR